MSTISEQRYKDVLELARLESEGEPTAETLATASRLMNSYYRLCGLCERNLYLANDEKTCNGWFLRYSEEREDKWYHRLKADFEKHYGYTLNYCAYYPSICHVKEGGGVYDKIYPKFYK